MSLLMDALKRAEEAKRHQQDAAAAAPSAAQPSAAPGSAVGTANSELSLEPVSAHSGSGLPDLDSHIDRVEADLKATAEDSDRPVKRRGAAATAPGASSPVNRNAAQIVFAAKESSAEPNTQAKRLIIIGSVGALAAAMVGAYFYWQLDTIAASGNRLAARPGAPYVSRPPVNVAALPQPAMATGAPERPATAGTDTSATSGTSAAKAATEEQKRPPKAGKAHALKPSGTDAPEVDNRKAARSVPGETAAKARKASATESAPASEPALRFSTQSHESLVVRAYDDLQAGRLDAARAGYQQALRADRRNADALAGLGAVSQRDGNAESAERYYLLAVESDPRHAGAHAGLASLRDDGAGTESRLKNLIAQQGNEGGSGPLHFALGNHYAGLRRWSDAQQSFFRAHTSDAEHPDYLANLAVSLDHLGQSALARQYYDKAIKAAEKRPAAFDKAGVEKRLADLGR